MKYTAAILTLVILISSCHSKPDTESATDDRTVATKPQGFEVKQLAGVFFDTIACTDCPGIATKMYLKPDKTFIMQKQNKSKNVSYQTGTWNIADSLLQLTGTDSPQLFKIDSYAKLLVLDKQGKEIPAGARKMELDRNNVPFRPLQPVPVAGMFTAKGDTITLHICSMNRDYQGSLASTALITTLKYKQVAKDGQSVYAKLAGHFELRPSLNDTTTQDFFVIEKFISFDAKGACK